MIQVAAIIPALNPTDKLVDIVSEILNNGIAKVIVINDGSSTEFNEVFDACGKVENCHVLHHEINMGKGVALKTAFKYFLNNFNDLEGCITADADGQHSCEDICNIAKYISNENPALILGVRNFDLDHIPFRSYFGNKATSKIFQYIYGGDYIQDTQTGLRGIPKNELSWMTELSGDRYEYEINMLLSARKRLLDIVQVPIQTLYFDNNSESHYNPLKDSCKIFCKMINGMSNYIVSGILSGAIDIMIFYLLNSFILSGFSAKTSILIATVIARISSSLCNFSVNRKFVFKNQCGFLKSMKKYYVLFICQMFFSYLLVYISNVYLNLNASISKIVIDILLALISYQIQLRWVFLKS